MTASLAREVATAISIARCLKGSSLATQASPGRPGVLSVLLRPSARSSLFFVLACSYSVQFFLLPFRLLLVLAPVRLDILQVLITSRAYYDCCCCERGQILPKQSCISCANASGCSSAAKCPPCCPNRRMSDSGTRFVHSERPSAKK